MKSTIEKKILVVILAPFLIIFLALSLYIAYMVFQYVNNWTELEIKGISEINAAQLEGKIFSVQVSVQSASDTLAILDPGTDNARKDAESIIQSMFANTHIYNAWLAYEPQAFDGKDAENAYDYPGSPSGRFIRSYIVDKGEIITAPDMDDVTIDDEVLSPWYTIPRDSGRLYVDVNNENANLYDYGIGGDPVYTLSVVAPIFRDGRVIGCVGADVIFLEMTFGIDNSSQAAVAVFYPDGRIFFSQNLAFAEESVDTLRFTRAQQIKDAILQGRSLFLPDEYSIFLDSRAFTYFQPVSTGAGNDCLYLYVATPRAEAFNMLRPLIILISAILGITFIVIFIIILHVRSSISKPIQSLTHAANAISQGDLETEIPSFANDKSEIGAMARSLHTMVNQFRIYIARMEQAQEEMAVHTQIWDFIEESDDVTQVFDRLSEMVCRHMDLHTVTAVYMNGASAVIRSAFRMDGERTAKLPQDFIYHAQIEALIAGKDLVYLNHFSFLQLGLQFAAPDTVTACIVPIRAESKLYGYLILEHKDKDRAFGEGEESLLTYIAQILADWLSQREESGEDVGIRQEEVSAPETMAWQPSGHGDDLLSALRAINGLAVDEVLAHMGGLAHVYEHSLRLLIREIPESLEKLSRHIEEKDLRSFSVGVHGMKGALRNIGATGQAALAEELENAALSYDMEACGKCFPDFRERLLNLIAQIEAALKG